MSTRPYVAIAQAVEQGQQGKLDDDALLDALAQCLPMSPLEAALSHRFDPGSATAQSVELWRRGILDVTGLFRLLLQFRIDTQTAIDQVIDAHNARFYAQQDRERESAGLPPLRADGTEARWVGLPPANNTH